MSAVFGVIGATIWWLQPPTPKGLTPIVQRFLAGILAGFLLHVLSGISPLDQAGNWNGAGVIQLIIGGYAGLATLGGILPQLNADSMQSHTPKLHKRVKRIRTKIEQKKPADAIKDLLALEASLESPHTLLENVSEENEEP